MRLLTHNVLSNNSPKAKGNGYPLGLTQVTSVRVDPNNDDIDDNNNNNKVEFVKGIIPTLHWPALVQVGRNISSKYICIIGDQSLVGRDTYIRAQIKSLTC
jgi:hypothetical protein